MGILPITMLLLNMIATTASYAYDVSAEWVNGNDLQNRDDCATGFYNEMSNDPYWDGRFIYGDWLAWERDWKDPSKGGHDDIMVDNTHFAFFAGHGSNVGFYFISSVDDQELRYSDALWGNTNLDWITIDACSVLNQSNPDGGVVNWCNAFEGLHSMCGFDTHAHDYGNRGDIFAKRMDGTWAEYTIVQAWLQAAQDTEGPDTYAAVFVADADGSTSTMDCWFDRIYGHGSSVNPPANPSFWWYAKYQC